MSLPPEPRWPQIRTAGYDGFVVSFGERLSDAANSAAMAFRDAIDRAGWDGVEESSTSLVSAYLRFDPLVRDHGAMRVALEGLVQERDWYAAPLPTGRRLWRVPTVFGGEAAPQLAEAAKVAGLSEARAIASISATQVRVQTIGFAPGMPYLGELPPEWDIPRQTQLHGASSRRRALRGDPPTRAFPSRHAHWLASHRPDRA